MLIRPQNLDATQGPIFRKFLLFAFPIMIMNLLQLLFNAADMIVVGRVAGSDALAAVGATAPLINLIVNLFMGLSVGTSVIVAQDRGAGHPEQIRRSVHTSVAISIVGGVLVMVTGFVFCVPLLGAMGTPDNIFDQSVLYMRIYFLGMPASMVYNFGAGILRAVGDSRRPMYYLVIAGIVNVVLNLIFVIGMHIGVAGVAWATTISQYLSMVLILVCLVRSEDPIRLYLRRLRIDRKKLVQIVRIGLPAGLQGLLFSISNVLIQSAVNTFGSTLIAASSAAGNVEGFVGTSMNAYNNAAITFAGQNMGARKYDRIDTVAKVSTVLVFATWVILGGPALLLGRPLLGLYTSDPEVVRLGMIRLTVLLAAYFSCGIMNVFPGLSRGMGYSILPMLSTLTGACLLRIVWLYTFFAWYPTVFMIFIAYPITWTLAGIGQVGVFLYARRQIRLRDPDWETAAAG
ncbi:MAG: MATE family efflux transporter [Clostridiaceae bacterium]|nr:MATE family efflux transporter [Clostridiaceae bacterium]